jgi:CSLREA domain-containing protein
MKALALTILFLPLAAAASTITVNTTADNTKRHDHHCTLREAIANVNASADTTKGDCAAATGAGDTIVFALALPTTITLTTGSELAVSKDVTIAGPANVGAASAGVIIDGNQHGTRVFNVTAGSVVLKNLTIQNGGSDGLGGVGITVANGAKATLNGCTLIDNEDDRGVGGAIANNGVLALTASTVGHNVAFSAPAIFNSDSGTATLTDCTLDGNATTYDIDSFGGAIYNKGTMALAGCTLNDNTTGSAEGGAIYNVGSMTLNNCTLSGNYVGTDDGGGAIENGGTMTLTGCTLTNNSVQDEYPGGAIENNWLLTLTNCTLVQNWTFGSGGALANYSKATLINCTLADNVAGPDDAGAAIDSNVGEGGATVLINTVLSNNLFQANGQPPFSQNCAGPIVDGGHNLSTDATCFAGPVTADVHLAPLGYYGGTTQTLALCTGIGIPDPECSGLSPAIDSGDDAVGGPPYGVTTDQRGLPRKTGLHVDVGAYEVQPQDRLPVCIGDCNDDRQVTVDEFITLANIALGTAQPSACPNRVAEVDIALLILAVNNALYGCSSVTPALRWLPGCGPPVVGQNACPASVQVCTATQQLGASCARPEATCCQPESDCTGTLCNSALVCTTKSPTRCPI